MIESTKWYVQAIPRPSIFIFQFVMLCWLGYSHDGRILFWDVRMAREPMVSLDQYNGKKSAGAAHTGYVLSLEFLENGYHLLSYGSDNMIRLWDTFTGTKLQWTGQNVFCLE